MPGNFLFDAHEYDENHERGYRDGAEGNGYDAPFGSAAAIAGYRDGYDEGCDDQADREGDVR
jgi:hypothetical protein